MLCCTPFVKWLSLVTRSCRCPQSLYFLFLMHHVAFSHRDSFLIQTWHENLMFLQYVEQKGKSVTERVKHHMSTSANFSLLFKHNTFHCHLLKLQRAYLSH